MTMKHSYTMASKEMERARALLPPVKLQHSTINPNLHARFTEKYCTYRNNYKEMVTLYPISCIQFIIQLLSHINGEFRQSA